MKVYLLRPRDERCPFYSEGPETPDEDESSAGSAAAARAGWRGWAERKYGSLQTSISGAESGIGLQVRRAWQWLQRRADPDEAMLRSLRNAGVVHLYHPSTMEGAEALALWTNYLKRRSRHHSLWLVLNGLITPLTVLLAPLPGPNIIGYWFLYRAICHLLAVLGARRALNGETETVAAGVLDELLLAGAGEKLWGEAGARLGLKNTDAFMRQAAPEAGEKKRAGLALS